MSARFTTPGALTYGDAVITLTGKLGRVVELLGFNHPDECQDRESGDVWCFHAYRIELADGSQEAWPEDYLKKGTVLDLMASE